MKSVNDMTNGEINRALESNLKKQLRLNAKLIERGFGNVRISEFRSDHADDVDVARFLAFVDEASRLRNEAERRYGPGFTGRLPIQRRAARKNNPKSPISAARRNDAIAKFAQFHDVDPDQIVEITIDELPAAVWTLGELADVTYYAPNFEGKPTLFRHKFRATARPLLTVTPEHKLFITGGRYRVDDRRGIVDQR